MEKQTVINPKTKRPIVVGGRVWVRLVREGILNSNQVSAEYEIEDTEPDKTEPEMAEPDNDDNNYLVKGRGKNKGLMVKKAKPLNPEQIHKHISESAIRAIKKYKSTDNDGDDSDLNKLVQQMIMDEMLNNDDDSDFEISLSDSDRVD
tara:strand:+ start:6127 stop:6570 length:444 start_codon:yes stop_codon:yes gene_type:complete